ncbi:MAG: SDR family NAD(P)-dependent oxidoreductase [Ketobacteraceae bacterium]|nr:SDR family NAD(P)-dependent oxidoreductase [Ketobacteraceae bacterium]
MNYLVTGGTGFIGRYVIRELLRQPGAVIHAVVRDGSKQKMASIRRELGADTDKLRLLPGDITLPGLGLTETDQHRLTGRIDHLFHLAALYDLSAPAEHQQKTNVNGTRHALEAASNLKAGCFHHVSSIAVAGQYPATFTEAMFAEAGPLENPYFLTKHLSEKCVREEAGVPWRIYRPSMVVGDSNTGEMDKLDGPYYLFQLLEVLARYLPPNMPLPGIEGGQFNIVPVDYVASALVHIAHKPGYDGQCFHLTDSRHYRLGELLDLVSQQDSRLPSFPAHIPNGLLNLLPKKALPAFANLSWVKKLMHRWNIAPEALHYITNATTYDRVHTASALSDSSIVPPALPEYMPALWSYWKQQLSPRAHPQAPDVATAKQQEVLFRRPEVKPYFRRARDHWKWNTQSVLQPEKALRERVNGKVVLLTGASSGIGEKVAHRLAEAGAIVLLVARSRDKLDAIASAIRAQNGKAFVYPADLSDGDDCDRVCECILAEHQHIDILINNAGRSIRRSVKFSLERFHDYERTMRLNYFGSVRMILNCLPGMLARGDGHIINVSTVGVQANPARFSAYLGSKWALEGWSWAAANELAHTGVTVSTINYPLVRTPMIAPTKIYKYTPAMSPEKAVDWMLDMIITRNKRKVGPMGLGALAMYYALPKTSESIVNFMYQMVYEAPPGDRAPARKARRLTTARRAARHNQSLKGTEDSPEKAPELLNGH